jgi:small subunit ribosomal protein S3
MGQKVHPYGFRLGVTKNWRSRWFAKQDYAKLLHQDLKLKQQLRDRLKAAGVSSVEVERPGQSKLRITIFTSRPGIIIGRKGAEIEKLKLDLAKQTGKEVFIDIQEVHKPEMDAQLVAESIGLQLEKRVAFRRAMRKAVESAQRFGCKGIKVRVSGRLNGAEIARSEWYLQGQLPLHTLRADIDYGFAQAYTTYGVIGIKCWVYRGEVPTDGFSRRARTDEPRRNAPMRDRRERRPSSFVPPSSAPPVFTPAPAPQAEPAGGLTQAIPADLPRPAATVPVTAPVPPVAPSWKQDAAPEAKPETAPDAPPVE